MPYGARDSLAIGERVRVAISCPDENHDWPTVGGEGTVVELYGMTEVLVDFSENENCPAPQGGARWWCMKNRLEPAIDHPFYLVTVDGKTLTPVPNERTYATGKEAADRAKVLSAIMGVKVQPRQISGDSASSSWREREKARLLDGTYLPMPATWDLPEIPDHFLHLSVDEPTKVSYTETPEKGVLDRQVRTTPGRYLEKFHAHLPDLDRKRYIAMIDKPEALFIATTADEIEAVYRNGPSSCMAYEPGHYHSFCHPVRVYGDSDLAVAYLKNGPRISARAMIWPDRKIYGRCYGDEARIIHALDSEGYAPHPNGQDRPCFGGARIPKLFDEKKNKFVMPYVDWHATADDDNPGEKTGYFLLREDAKGNVHVQSQRGHAMVYKTCPKLGTHNHDPEAFRMVHGQSEPWSAEACEQYAQRCTDPVTGADLGWYLTEETVYFRREGYTTREIAERVGFQSALSDGWTDDRYWHLNSERVVLSDGRAISRHQYRDRDGYVCAGSGDINLSDSNRRHVIRGRDYSDSWLTQQAVRLGVTRFDLMQQIRQAGGHETVIQAVAA